MRLRITQLTRSPLEPDLTRRSRSPRTKLAGTFVFCALVSITVVACATPTPEIVEVTRIVEATSVKVTVVVEATPSPQPQGGTIVHSSLSDPVTLNPILWDDEASRTVGAHMFLALLKVDPYAGELVGEVAESWEASQDGLTYTFNLRKDIEWSDGTPLTAHDVKFTYDAIASEVVDSPRKSDVAMIESIEAIDDHTVQMTFSELDCTVLNKLVIGLLPSHLYAEDFSDIMSNSENMQPSAVSGPFHFSEWFPGDHLSLVKNDGYYLGAPNVGGWTLRIFGDASEESAAILAGEVDIATVDPEAVSMIESRIAQGDPLDIHKFLDDRYSWVALNLGDPDNPQHGFEDLDGDGIYTEDEPVLEQDPHPILSDGSVRQAIARAVDVQAIVNQGLFGEGAQIPANVLPSVGWAFDSSLELHEFDLEQAETLLDQAGWEKGADGIRRKDGETLSLTLETNAGNETREQAIASMRETLNSIGFDITAQTAEFNSLVERLRGQTYDMVLLGWPAMGFDPDDVGLWEYRFDTVGSGLNVASYYNEDMEAAAHAARTLPGCDLAERAEYYKDIQQVLHEDTPFIFLFAPFSNVVWNTRLYGINPGPWGTYDGVHTWSISP